MLWPLSRRLSKSLAIASSPSCPRDCCTMAFISNLQPPVATSTYPLFSLVLSPLEPGRSPTLRQNPSTHSSSFPFPNTPLCSEPESETPPDLHSPSCATSSALVRPVIVALSRLVWLDFVLFLPRHNMLYRICRHFFFVIFFS
jgi:hypothetical protein